MQWDVSHGEVKIKDSILDGLISVNVKLARWRKARKKTQALPLSGRARSEARYSGSVQEMGAKGENFKERMGMAKRYSCTPSQ